MTSAIYIVPAPATQPDWGIFMQQIVNEKKPTVIACGYCGAPITLQPIHTNKEYCNATCGRRARYLREHGRRPHSPRFMPPKQQ